jgi:hypothetical protein
MGQGGETDGLEVKNDNRGSVAAGNLDPSGPDWETT